MKFSGLTKKGRLYLAKIQAAEEPIQFTKIKFGDGKLSEHENPADLVDIKNIKVEKSILNKEQKEDAVILTNIIDNVGLVEGYFPRETGIYVQDEDQEVLYFYMNDGDETSWLPPEVDGPHKMEMKINLISSNTGSVLVHNDGKDLYITKDYLESNYTQKGNFNGTAQDIEDRVVAAVGKEDGKFPLTESVAGNIYYFPGNKKFYYCLKSQTSRVSVPNADFEELSIYQNRKKLENLIKVTILRKADVDPEFLKYFGLIQVIKVGKIVIFSGVVDQTLNNAINISRTVIGNLPYKPSEEIWVDPGFTIKPNGEVQVGAFLGISQKKITAQQHINFAYIASE